MLLYPCPWGWERDLKLPRLSAYLGGLLAVPRQPCSLSPLLMALLSPQDDDVDPKKQKTDEDD